MVKVVRSCARSQTVIRYEVHTVITVILHWQTNEEV